MIAYYVNDSKKETDLIVLPDMGCSIAVDAGRMEAFISVNPDLASGSENSCGELSPEDFGTIVAADRDEGGDVVVVNHDLWRRRMAHYLGEPS
jgi:hypothetical protein